MKFKIIFCIAIVCTFAWGFIAGEDYQEKHDIEQLTSQLDAMKAARNPKCNAIHKPKTGCPPNSTLLAGLFSEKDGSRQDACYLHDPTLAPCIDVLNPGEGMSLDFSFPASTETTSNDASTTGSTTTTIFNVF